MRVLHVYRTYFPETQGGLEEVICQICTNAKAFGVESRVFTLSKNTVSDIIIYEGTEIHRFPLSFEIASCGFSKTAFEGFKGLAEWADIIHYHFPWPFGDILHTFNKIKTPSIVTYHSDIVRQKWLMKIYKPLMHHFLNKMDVIVATSENYFATSDVLGKYSDKVRVIPIGINDRCEPIEQYRLNEWQNTVGVDFFLFVGVLRYYKGLHILLEALINSKHRVVIVGSGPIEKDLKAHAKRLKLTNVIFLGYLDDKDKTALIKLSLGIVFPSYLRSEAYGVTLLEGAMFGKPLISTEIGSGTSYINKNDETGIVIPPSDPNSLQNAMDRIAKDKKLAKKMGLKARERYEELFSGDLMGEKYSDLYKQLSKNYEAL